jgi:lysophospholipase L1-like esterase
MKTDPLLIFFLAFLSATILVLILIIILITSQLRKSTKLKAKQFARYNSITQKNNIIFLGDSLTEFFPVDEFFHFYNPYNRGIASDTTEGVWVRLESNVIAMEPRKVFLQIGTNDLIFRKAKNPDTVTRNIIRIVERLRESLPETKLYLISLYPVNKRAKFFSAFFVLNRKNKDIQTINKKLKQYCEERDVPFIDLYTLLIDEKGDLRKEYTVEGLHLNFNGYEQIAKILLPYLEE